MADLKYLKKINSFEESNHVLSDPVIIGKVSHPLVSILIPTFKRPDMLKQTIYSALSQEEVVDYEVIVVDNECGNFITDAQRVVEGIASDKLSYFKNQTNLGMVGNWNRCLQLSNAEWITILHDDDLLNPDYLKVMLECINVSDDKGLAINLLAPNVEVMDQRAIQRFSLLSKLGIATDFIKQKKSVRSVGEVESVNYFFGNKHHGTLGVMFRKNFAIKLGGFGEKYYPISDYVFWLNYTIMYGGSYLVSGPALCKYRIAVNESINVDTISAIRSKSTELKREYVDKYCLSVFCKKILGFYIERQNKYLLCRAHQKFVNDCDLSKNNQFKCNFLSMILMKSTIYLLESACKVFFSKGPLNMAIKG